MGKTVENELKYAQILILDVFDTCCMSFNSSSFAKHLLPPYCF